MSTSNCRSLHLGRRAIRALVAVLGVAAIVGSGGGGIPDVSYEPPPPSPPVVAISPSRVTVQAGATVQFRASASASNYQWQRDGVNIAGANSSTYTLVGANLGDDGARFSVVVSNTFGTTTATGLLQVSSLPGVVYQDDFDSPQLNWKVTAVAEPVQADTKLIATRSETGGDPGAFMQVAFELPAGPSSIRVFHTYLAATYDPAQQGAIYGVDVAADCRGGVYVRRMLEQAGRRFASQDWGFCVGSWLQPFSLLSLRANEFLQVDGPTCAAGEACPDFSAQGGPIRFGLMTGQEQPSDTPARTFTCGVDGWRVTVWRK